MKTLSLLAVLVPLIVGCSGKKRKPPGAVEAMEGPVVADPLAADVLARAVARSTPATLRARFGFKIRSEVLGVSGSTGGALITERPGQGHVAVLGPLGNLMANLRTDGQGLAVLVSRGRQQVGTPDAVGPLERFTDGLLTIDSVLALAVGELPVGTMAPEAIGRSAAGDVVATYRAANDTRLTVVVDPTNATPREIQLRDAADATLFHSTYGPFETVESWLQPSELDITVPRLELELSVKFKRWEALEEAPPGVFDLAAPEGFSNGRLEDVQFPTLPGASEEPG